MEKKQDSWFVPSVHHSLTQAEVQKVSDDLNCQCPPELIEAVTDDIANVLKTLEFLDTVDGYLPEVKYPRTPGHRPNPQENPGNAWAWLCDIPGAPKGKLSGKRLAIKDNVAVAGVPMANGSLVLEGYVPEYDATIVTRILDAGGRIVGKASCDDFCFSAMGYSSVQGYIHLPQTPHLRVAGSSGGSAVLVATGVVDLAIAGDQGGSIRIPSCWSGVVGLKPTHGLVPYTGIVSIEPTLDHVGPIARNVTDCALFLEVIAGNNGIDPRQKSSINIPEYSKMLEVTSNFKLGLLKEGLETCNEEVQTLTRTFLDKVSVSDQLKIVDVTAPLHKHSTNLTAIIIQGGTTCLKQGTTPLCVDGFHSTSLQKAVKQGIKSSSHMFSPGVKLFLIFNEILNRRYGNHYDAKARNVGLQLRQQIDEALDKCDVIIMPTLTALPYELIRKGDKSENFKQYLSESISMIGNTMVYNITGHPALTIPLGKVGDPSQPGLMIVGRHYDEVKVLQVGRALEKIVEASL